MFTFLAKVARLLSIDTKYNFNVKILDRINTRFNRSILHWPEIRVQIFSE